jgi:hypothetical protein
MFMLCFLLLSWTSKFLFLLGPFELKSHQPILLAVYFMSVGVGHLLDETKC